MSISLRAIEMISRMKSKAPTLEIKAFRSLHHFKFEGETSVVVVTKNSDYNRITRAVSKGD